MPTIHTFGISSSPLSMPFHVSSRQAKHNFVSCKSPFSSISTITLELSFPSLITAPLSFPLLIPGQVKTTFHGQLILFTFSHKLEAQHPGGMATWRHPPSAYQNSKHH